MSGLDEVRAERVKKLELLRTKGYAAYPATVTRRHELGDVLRDFAQLETEGATLSVAGRVMVVRGQGAILFAVLKDGTGSLQLVIKADELTPEAFSLFTEVVDAGDFIEASGTLFTTNRGEKSVLVKSWQMVTKSLLPLPDKFHGLQDEEERLRKRYLDLLTKDELRDLFVKKALFWDTIRRFMKERGFLEVETPTLEVTTGGAEARPFVTHHNDYDMPVYLRISVGELWQKRLMAAGFPKTFEIGKVYRNEGSSPEHLQEFTNLEFYWAYANYEEGMTFVRELYITIAQEVFGTTKFEARGHTFDLAREWDRIDYTEEIKARTGIDILTATDDEMKAKLTELGVRYEGANRERLTDTLWKYCRKHIAGPAFLVNHPTLVAPLAKTRADGRTVEMFQPIIAGSEVGRGYSELNDPIDQRQRFETQQRLLEAGDEEAMMPDFEFVEMLEHGMPPTCGFGFGERLFAFLAGATIRDTQLFPLVKPK